MPITSLLILFLILLPAGTAWAQNDPKEPPTMMGLQLLDWLVIAVYGLSTIGLGVYFSSRQRDTKEYFTGGGNMHPGLIGVSIFVTGFSTISFLSTPGEIINHGPVILTGVLTIPVVYYIVG